MGLIYEAGVKHMGIPEVLATLPVIPDPFTVELLDALVERSGYIDDLLAAASVGWELGRMPAVDRSILRMAVAELLSCPETPVAVILNEAVELAKEFSTEQSGPFVNGVLAALAAQIRPV